MKPFIFNFILFLIYSNAQSQVDCIDLVSKDSLTYYNDVPYNGSCEYYYKCVFLTTRLNYIDGKLDGKAMYWFTNGNKQYEIDYENGYINGFYNSYFRNGNLKKSLEYVNDNQCGLWREYYKNGKIKSETDYDSNGRYVDGEYYKWNKKGEKYKYSFVAFGEKKSLGKMKFIIYRSKRIKVKVI